MNIVMAIVIFSFVQISLYVYLKNGLKDFFLYNVNHANYTSPNLQDIAKPIAETKPTLTVTNEAINNNHKILNQSLKHLEFILRFEMYLEDKNCNMFPIEFLQEFKKVKQEAQITTLKSAHRIINENARAA